MYRRSLIFWPILTPIFSFVFIILFLPNSLMAETLKVLAHKSTLLLVMADDPALQKKCQLTPQKISILSQKLKASVDQKIESLNEADFKILNQRIAQCHTDCTCTIYALAYETKNKPNTLLAEKAQKETLTDRQNCVTKQKNICSMIKKM